MRIKVRYLSEDEIEKEAELLLAEYAETAGGPIKLPVPVEDITTYHLALQLGFADLHETLRIPMLRDQTDILGAIWVDTEAVLIDRSLDPKHNPSMVGRYRFSVATKSDIGGFIGPMSPRAPIRLPCSTVHPSRR